MKQRTHLKFKFREPNCEGPTDLCSTVDGVLLDLPQGHRLKLETFDRGTSMQKGFYEVYRGPYDTLFVARDQESTYERCYSLRYVDESKLQ